MIPHIQTKEFLKLASGDNLALQIYQFIGQRSGKKVYIQANLHGSEIVGNAVIYQLIEYFSSLKSEQIQGDIILVPACNPLGTNQRNHFFATGRYNSYDGKDWNRIFWDYEKEVDLKAFAQAHLNCSISVIQQNFLNQQKVAFAKKQAQIHQPRSVRTSDHYRYLLQSFCLDANYVIDIHSSSNLGIDYVYCFQGREESAKYLGLNYAILMTKYDGDAFDEAFLKPWLALEKQFATLGHPRHFDVEAWTLELGSGMEMNPQSVAKGVAGIKNYLIYHKILNIPDQSPKITDVTFIKRQHIQNYYAPTGGMIQQRLPLKQSVKAGERLYQLLSFNKVGQFPTVIDICAETSGIVFDLSINHSVNQGEYVLGFLKSEPS